MEVGNIIFWVIIGLYVASAIRKSLKKQREKNPDIILPKAEHRPEPQTRPEGRRPGALERLKARLEEMGREFQEALEVETPGRPSRRLPSSTSLRFDEEDGESLEERLKEGLAAKEKAKLDAMARSLTLMADETEEQRRLAAIVAGTPLAFRKREGVVRAVVFNEILGLPLSKRPRGRGGFGVR